MTTEESKIDCVENTLNELLNVQRDIIERELKHDVRHASRPLGRSWK